MSSRRAERREAWRRRHRQRRERWHAHHGHHAKWGTLRLLHSRIQRRIFAWFVVVIIVSLAAARWIQHMGAARWWTAIPVVLVIGMASGAIAWRLTWPLLAVIDAARKIGDGDLSTRIKTRHQHGELQDRKSVV